MKVWKTEKKKLSEMKAAEYNPRKISDRALQGLSNSIDRFGLVEPIIWNKRTNRIVGGHQRFKVLQEKGIEETDVMVVDLDENDEVALNITLNNPIIQGEFNERAGELLKELEKTSEEIFADLRMDDLQKALSASTFNSEIPSGNKPIDENDMANTKNECPKCGFKW